MKLRQSSALGIYAESCDLLQNNIIIQSRNNGLQTLNNNHLPTFFLRKQPAVQSLKDIQNILIYQRHNDPNYMLVNLLVNQIRLVKV